MITVEVISNPKFGECIKLENGYAELMLSLDYGPRILSYRLADGENILFEDTNQKVYADDESIRTYFDMGDKWYMYGGHRLWAAPEAMPKTYFPDNRTVDYELMADGALLKQMDQIKNGLSFSIEVRMEKDSPKVRISHTIKNIGKLPKELAVWGITGLCPGGVCLFEMPDLHKAFLPNRNLAIWPYTDMKDDRLDIGTKYIALRQDPKKFKACKIGMNNEAGYAAYAKDDTLFSMYYEHHQEGSYPDKNVSFETYTNGYFLEMESLGELKELKPGESATHDVEWNLKKAKGFLDLRNEESIDRYLVVNLGAAKTAVKTGAFKK